MRIFQAALIISAFFLAATFYIFPLQSDDLFMYLAMAKKYFELGHFPTTDVFLVRPLPWHMEHQWLSYFFFYGLFQCGGYLLISVAKVLLLLATTALPFCFLRRDPTSQTLGAGALLLTCFAANFRFFERSELFTNFFAQAVLVICLLELRKPSRLKWFLPSIFVLWMNLHPGFPLGFAFLAAAVAASLLQKSWKQARDLSICLVLCVLACLINPLGIQGLLYPFEFSASYAPFLKQYYFEWYSPFHSALRTSPHLPFLIALQALTFFVLLSSSLLQTKARPWFQWMVFVVASYFCVTGVRFAPLCGFIFISLCMSVPVPESKRIKYPLGALALLCLGVGVKNIMTGYDSISGHRDVAFGVDERVVPVKAVEWMKANHLQGPIFNSHMFGAYLAWAWDGKYMYDGSITNPEYFLNEYVPFSRSREDFDRQASKYQIQGVLLDRFVDAQSMVSLLAQHPDWKLVYSDDGSLIFARQR